MEHGQMKWWKNYDLPERHGRCQGSLRCDYHNCLRHFLPLLAVFVGKLPQDFGLNVPCFKDYLGV